MKKMLFICSLALYTTLAFGDPITGKKFWMFYNFTSRYLFNGDNYYKEGLYGMASSYMDYGADGILKRYDVEDGVVDLESYRISKYKVEEIEGATIIRTGKDLEPILVLTVMDGAHLLINSSNFFEYKIADFSLKEEYYYLLVSDELYEKTRNKKIGQ